MRRVLALWQPWATLCVAPDPSWHPVRPAKNVETRHFEPRGQLPIDVVIHATKKWNGDLRVLTQQWPFKESLTRAGYYAGDPRRPTIGLKALPLGALIGVATIVRVVPTASLIAAWSLYEDGAAENYAEQVALGNYESGRFGWILAKAVAFETPIPFTGRQDVLYPLPSEYQAQVEAQLAKVAA